MDYRTLKYVPLATASTVLLPLVAKAAAENVGGEIPAFTPKTGAAVPISGLVNSVIRVMLWVVTAVAVIYLIISGFNYITAGGDQEKADAARKGIINAVIGIVVIVAVYFIINTATGLGEDITTNTIDAQL